MHLIIQERAANDLCRFACRHGTIDRRSVDKSDSSAARLRTVRRKCAIDNLGRAAFRIHAGALVAGVAPENAIADGRAGIIPTIYAAPAVYDGQARDHGRARLPVPENEAPASLNSVVPVTEHPTAGFHSDLIAVDDGGCDDIGIVRIEAPHRNGLSPEVQIPVGGTRIRARMDDDDISGVRYVDSVLDTEGGEGIAGWLVVVLVDVDGSGMKG